MTRIMTTVLVALLAAQPVIASQPGDVTGRYPVTDFPTGLTWDGRQR